MLHAALFAAAALAASPEPKFEAQVIDSNVAIGYGLQIGDVDGDGKPDILLADKKQFVWYPSGTWKRTLIAEDVTPIDNVCIAARDINGDGKVEIAVGAAWNPGDTQNSGSVHYLQRPASGDGPWKPIDLHREPTVHRMHWVKTGPAPTDFVLVVKPLHGRGNDPKKPGTGDGGKVIEYTMPADPTQPWKTRVILSDMHVSHNFDPIQWDDDPAQEILIGGLEGAKLLDLVSGEWKATPLFGKAAGDAEHVGVGEIRLGHGPKGQRFIATVEPFHGHMAAVYTQQGGKWQRHLLTDKLKDGHAVACGDVLGLGYDQIVVGWRKPDAEKKVGLKIFVPVDLATGKFQEMTLGNEVAVEDMKLADLNGDGKLDVIAAGRDSHNLVIYWNRR